MTLPNITTKGMTLKDWIWIIGSGCAVVGSWYVMGQDISYLKQTAAKQEIVDGKQDIAMKGLRDELTHTINRNADEIKLDIRELRNDINRRSELKPR